jgi:NAD+ synthase (glutamine-hydrolysing)
MINNGFAVVAAGHPEVNVGNCDKNAENIINLINKIYSETSANLIVMPELCITGYTANDLFNNDEFLDKSFKAVLKVVNATSSLDSLIIVGAPFKYKSALYNCAFVISKGNILGIVPKQNIPNYKEFQELRWFSSGEGIKNKVINKNVFYENYVGKVNDNFNITLNFGVNYVFKNTKFPEFIVGVEICEDLWMPIAPSAIQSIYGNATILTNLSASNETVGKSEYRGNMVAAHSGKCIAAYVYSSAGVAESTTDLVFSGDCIIAENGSIIGRTEGINQYIREEYVTKIIDVQRLMQERRKTTSFANNTNNINLEFEEIEFSADFKLNKNVKIEVDSHPFVPKNPETLANRCKHIFNIQVAGLVGRLKKLGNNPKVTIGVSGGLDSTLALLVTIKAFDLLNISRKNILGITMPGFGTTNRTKNNSEILMELFGITSQCISISKLALETFKALNHKPFGIIDIDDNETVETFEEKLKSVPVGSKDLTFENVQARERTKILMNKGFVIGTGDMSELALGWATYNGDHMSMYNVNCSIPKTLVKFLVSYVASTNSDNNIRKTLEDIVDTPISPELLPTNNGEIAQKTEESVGPYELHDFFLFQFIRNGFGINKIMFLTYIAFEGKYSRKEISSWMKVFINRFFMNQFKRSCVPDGPKVGSVSLSPRGDWRMPSDADCQEFLNAVEEAEFI